MAVSSPLAGPLGTAISSALSPPGGTALRLLRAGALSPLAAFARSTGATYFDGAGTLQTATANTPRFSAAGRLIVEEQRTNGARNPRAENCGTGTVAANATGFGGIGPTNWSYINNTTGLTTDVSPVALNGMGGVRLRLYGTATGTGQHTVEFDNRTQFTFAAASTVTGSFYYRLAAGTPTSTLQARFIGLDSAQAVVTNSATTQAVPDATLRRAVWTNATAATCISGMVGLNVAGFTAGQSYDFTIDVVGPQVEVGGCPTSLILPPAGVPGQSTRAADICTAALSPWFRQGAGTIVVRAMLPQAATGVIQGLCVADDGTASNRITLRNHGAADISGAIVAATVTNGAPNAGATTPGTEFRAAVAWDGSNVTVCRNAGGVVSAAAALPGTAFTLLRIGQNAANLGFANGEIAAVTYYPARLPDAALQALTAP